MVCFKCNHKTKPGILKGTKGPGIKVWYCDCGAWFHIPDTEHAEIKIWAKEFYKTDTDKDNSPY